MKLDYPIDFVVTWVDSTDPDWLAEYSRYRGSKCSEDAARFRSWDIFRYWFRAVENYSPWVNKIHVITCGHYPEWLNLNNPRISLVKHSDYIPKEFLPTFNSDTIELNMGRIENLAEHFVYFNDDMYLNSPVSPSYFFRKGLPVDYNEEKIYTACDSNSDANVAFYVSQFYNMCVLNRNFNRRATVKKSLLRWLGLHLSVSDWITSLMMVRRAKFEGFEDRHFEQPYLKSVFQEIWAREPKMLNDSCTQFRTPNGVMHWLARYWQFASNKFYPHRYGPCRYLQIMPNSIERIRQTLNDSKVKSVCLNDVPECSEDFYKSADLQLKEIFESKFPRKSSFEL